MEVDQAQEDASVGTSSTGDGKILYIGNLKQNTNHKWLRDYLRKETKDFLRLLVLQPAAKRTKYALAFFSSHSAAAEAVGVLKDAPLGPHDTPVVVKFKTVTRKSDQAVKDQRKHGEPQKRSDQGKDTEQEIGASKMSNVAYVTPKSVENSEAAKNTAKGATHQIDVDRAANVISRRLSKNEMILQRAKEKSSREIDNRRCLRSKYKVNVSSKLEYSRQNQDSTDKIDTSTISLSDGVLQKFPALQRFQNSHHETPLYLDQTCLAKSCDDEQYSFDRPSCFLHITGTNGVDEENLSEFFDRALAGHTIVQCDYKNGQALLQLSHVIYAEHAYRVLSGKHLSRSGAPIQVTYVQSWESLDEDDDDITDTLSQASEVESVRSESISSNPDHSYDQIEDKKTLRISVRDIKLRNYDFKQLMRAYDIPFDKIQVNHSQNDTEAVISLNSHTEAVDAERKLQGAIMGDPAEVIKTEVIGIAMRKNGRRNRRRNKRRNKQRQGKVPNDDGNILPDGLSDAIGMTKRETQTFTYNLSKGDAEPQSLARDRYALQHADGEQMSVSVDGEEISDEGGQDWEQNDDEQHPNTNDDDDDYDDDDDDDDDDDETFEYDQSSINKKFTSVLVRNIDRDIAEYQIREFLLEQEIDARDLEFFHSSSGDRGNYAVVQFEYPEEASEALKILKEEMGAYGDNLIVTFAENTPKRSRGKGVTSRGVREGRGKGGVRAQVGRDEGRKNSKINAKHNHSGNQPTPKRNVAKLEQSSKHFESKKSGNHPVANIDTKEADSVLSSNNVIIDDLPKSINESDIAEVVWKYPKLRSGFINSKLIDTKAILEFDTEVAALEAVAELHFDRVKGHILKARLAVHNPDLDKLMLRKQREALIAHIEETKNNIYEEVEEKVNDLAVEIASTDDDVLRQTLQHKLDESQGFHEEFKQTSANISEQIDSLTLDESQDKDNQTSLMQLANLSRKLEREGRRLKNPLPIYGSRTQIVEKVTDEETKACVIQAETGSGKSTQVPQYLMEYIHHQNISVPSGGVKGIICTQPRRVAAITLAQRIAEEYGCDVGQEVGFIAGNQKKVSEQTLATFMTDRALLSQCLSDPKYLDKYRYVIIDEAHERSVDTDILIAMLKKEQTNRHITIVIMSATIDVDLFSTYFHGCPVITIPGRTFPVDVEWCGGGTEGQGTSSDNYVSRAVQKSYDIHVNEDTQGDILVFLTSQNEIDRACNDLKRKLGITEEDSEGVDILPLHGKLQPQDQFKVFKKTPHGRRKIVFSTNIAETSVTIPGVKYVIDSGMVKELQYDTKKNMSLLKVTNVTQASAEQRRGRAGRTGPGKCYRLYSHEEYEEMEQTMKPEILRVHLGMAVTQLLQMGVKEIEKFQFVESPERGAIEQAIKSLLLLGAVTDNGSTLTELGYQMAQLPLEPRLAKMILEGAKHGVLEDAIAMAALISAPGNVYYQGGSEAERKVADQLKLRFCVEDGDVITLLGIFKEWQGVKGDRARNKWCKDNSLNAKTLRIVQENVDELKLTIRRSKVMENLRTHKPAVDTEQTLKEELMTGDVQLTATSAELTDHMIKSASPVETTAEETAKSKATPDISDEANHVVRTSTNSANQNEMLRKILMSAYFENLSVFNGHVRAGYTVASQLKTAVFHPSSALAALNSRPEWVIYGELRRTTKDFLCVVTPVDINWIHEVAPAEFSQHVDLEKLKSCVMTEMRVESIGTAVMRNLSRKRFEGVRNMEDEITSRAGVPCIIEANVNRGTLVAFIATHSKPMAKEIVEKSLEDIKSESERERIEVPIGTYGSIRHIVKSGGETDLILMAEDDFISVEWSGVSDDMHEEVLRQGLEEQGIYKEDIVQIFKYPRHWAVAKQGKWGKVTFVSPEKAQEAVECSSVIDPFGEIKVEPILPDMRQRALATGVQRSASINTRINVTWYTGRSKGIAFVDCADVEDATDVIEAVNGTRLRGRCIRCARGRKNPRSVFVSQLDLGVIPEELEEHIRDNTMAEIYKPFIPRVKSMNVIPDATYKKRLRRLFRQVCDNVEVNVLQERGLKRKAFVSLEPNLGQARRQELEELMDIDYCISDDNGPFSMKQIITCDLYCSQEVFRTVKNELQRKATQSDECEVEFEDTKRTPPDKRIRIHGESYGEVASLRRKLQEIIRPEVLHARDLTTEEASPMWIDKVLNKLTKERLPVILRRRKAHAYIHLRRQTIMMYGKENDRKSLKSDLEEFFTVAVRTMFREVNIPSRTGGQNGKAMRALIRQFGPCMDKLKITSGVDEIAVDLKNGILFIDGAEDAYNRLIEAVDECLIVVTNSDDAGTSETEPNECGVCFCPPSDGGSKPYRLAACGHFFCLACLKHHLKECGSTKKFPITCPECDESIMLCDIKTIYPQMDQRQELFKSGFDAHVASDPNGNIKFCPGPDCCLVYAKDDVGETQDCDECGYSFCNCCGEEAHPDGMNCKEFQVSKKETDDMEKWMRNSGADAKKCPKCKMMIEKRGGCNHMTCRMCKSHICWKCLKVFNSAGDCYDHLENYQCRQTDVLDEPRRQFQPDADDQFHDDLEERQRLQLRMEDIQRAEYQRQLLERLRQRQEDVRRDIERRREREQERQRQIREQLLRVERQRQEDARRDIERQREREQERQRQIREQLLRDERQRQVDAMREFERRQQERTEQRRELERRAEDARRERVQRMERLERQRETERLRQERQKQKDKSCIIL